MKSLDRPNKPFPYSFALVLGEIFTCSHVVFPLVGREKNRANSDLGSEADVACSGCQGVIPHVANVTEGIFLRLSEPFENDFIERDAIVVAFW